MEFLSQTDVIILSLGTLILGMAILVKGGDWTIDGAVEIARHYGMPPLLVGFTIVAFGTSLPELIASINANLKGTPGLAVGNVVGSNIANLLLIGGISALVSPLVCNIRAIRNDLIMMFGATCLWIYLLSTFTIGVAIGGCTLLLLIVYIIIQYNLTKRGDLPAEDILIEAKKAEILAPKDHNKAIIMVIGGLIGLALGAELLIRGSITLAKIANIPDTVIGLSIIAIGTSLPELTTCIIAALKKQSDVIIGNLVGSNVFNLMMILGSMGLIQSYDMREGEVTSLLTQDVTIMLAATLAFILTLIFFRRIPRSIGLIFTVAYGAYMILLAYQSI